MDELVRCGFPRQDLALKDSSTEAAAAEQGRVETGERDESFGQSVLHFFSDLFGAHHADTHVYTEAVSRGNTVLTFITDDQDKVERAADIIEAYGPVDIDEHEMQWRAGGWTGAESMRSGGYQGASMQTGQTGSSSGGSATAGMQSGTAGMTNTGASGTRSGMSTSTGSTASFGTGSQPLQGSAAPGSAIGGSSSQGSLQRDTMQGSTGSVPASSDLKMGSRTGQTGGVRVYSRVHMTSYLTGADHESAYRSHYMSHMAALGGGYEDYDPAYKYGSAMAHDPVYSGRSWDDIEPTLRGDWEAKNPGSAWERFKAAVRHGWERITSDDDTSYRSHWSRSYAGQGGSYEDYAPAYRYGSSMAATAYKGRPWDEVEPELRSSWESSHPSDAWERVKAGVRHGWDRITGDADDSAYRSHWSTNYAGSGSSYDEYEPAYRYGSSMASSGAHGGRDWDEVEDFLSSDWEKRNPHSTWERVKAAVRHGWERMKS